MSPLDRELERALARKAGDVTPPGDLFGGVQRRARRIRTQRRLAVGGTALAVTAMLVAAPVLLRDVSDRADIPPASTPTATAGEPSEPISSPTPDGEPSTVVPVERQSLPVYFLRDLERGPRLFREFHDLDVAVGSRGAEIFAAVTRSFERPADRDYMTPWPEGTRVLGVTVDGELATVDLSPEATAAQLGAESSAIALQQLVYTVTAADAVAVKNGASKPAVSRVRLLVGGRAQDDMWGHVDTSEPMTRQPHLNVLAPVWIQAPENGATVGRTFTVSGSATVFEATVSLRVIRGCAPDTDCDDALVVYVDDAFATADKGAPDRGNWSTRITLPDAAVAAGWVIVEAFESSAEDGRPMYLDTKLVRVQA